MEHICRNHIRPSWTLLSEMPYQYCTICGKMFFLGKADGDLSRFDELVRGGGNHFQIVARRKIL